MNGHVWSNVLVSGGPLRIAIEARRFRPVRSTYKLGYRIVTRSLYVALPLVPPTTMRYFPDTGKAPFHAVASSVSPALGNVLPVTFVTPCFSNTIEPGW